jgi:hypothetical protein
MVELLKSDSPNRLAQWVARYWIWLLISALIFIILPFLTPGAIYYWSYRGFNNLFHDNLGFGANISVVLSLVSAFFYAIAVPYTLRWLTTGKKSVQAFIALLIVFGSTPLLHVFLDANFDQTTGVGQKFYVWHPGGELVLSDKGGIDPDTGVEKKIITAQIASIIIRQKKGIRPNRILSDPRKLQFFDGLTGRPLVWFSVSPDNNYRFYDAEGFDFDFNAQLIPVAAEVAADARRRADDADLKMQSDAKERAERAAAAAKEQSDQAAADAKRKARDDLQRLFGVASYPDKAVLVGARARQRSDSTSQQAAQAIIRYAISSASQSGTTAWELRSAIYDSPYFDALVDGDSTSLEDSGLAQRIKVVLLIVVDSSCKPTTSVGGLTSCTVVAQTRALGPSRSSWRAGTLTEVGIGGTRDDAIIQASQNLVDRRPELFRALGR